MIDYLKCHMNITSHRPQSYLGDEALQFDAVVPRIGAARTFFGTAVVRQFEMTGTYSINESVAISRSRDKLRSLQLLARKGLGLPVTAFAHDTKATGHILDFRAAIGANIRRMDATSVRLDDLSLSVTRLLSEVEDADIIKVTTELATQENVYQAALNAVARVIQPSLVDFIR